MVHLEALFVRLQLFALSTTATVRRTMNPAVERTSHAAAEGDDTHVHVRLLAPRAVLLVSSVRSLSALDVERAAPPT